MNPNYTVVANYKMLYKIQHNLIRRRLINEYKHLRSKYTYISITISNYKTTTVTIICNNNRFKFIIGEHYPFIQPIALINGIVYTEHLCIPFTRLLSTENILYSKYSRYKSHMSLCHNNWSVSCTINQIIDECNELMLIKTNILLTIMVDKLKDKYLLQDINIIEWLF